MSDLRECPFCGSVRISGSGIIAESWASCDDCEARGPVKEGCEASAAAWNRRAGGWLFYDPGLSLAPGRYLFWCGDREHVGTVPAPPIKGVIFACIVKPVTHYQPLPAPPTPGGPRMTRTRATLAALLLAPLLSGCAAANAVAVPRLDVSPYPTPTPTHSSQGRVWCDPYIAAPPVEAPEEGP